MTLYPYLLRDTWVFDDARTKLKQEAFVCGASEMISRLVSSKRIRHAEKGFSLTFLDKPFDGHDAVLSLLRPDEYEGNWYHGYVAGLRMECWLCPALFCYFAAAPEKIYVRAEPLPQGVNPIWEPRGDEEPRRFVEAPNACLIAAAPELLEALRQCTEVLRKWCVTKEDEHVIRNAEAVVAKAEGSSRGAKEADK